jgi:outer membrane receptor protein involved in Fe transport
MKGPHRLTLVLALLAAAGTAAAQTGPTGSLNGRVMRHRVGTNLPEEQATEFEKIENFQQFLLGYTSEADTQYGFTDKEFGFYDASAFVTDSWRVNNRLSVSAGLRWDWFGWPVERTGFSATSISPG